MPEATSQIISIGTRTWSSADLRSVEGQKALEDARLQTLVVACQCDPTCLLPLAVKRRGRGAYFLARFPNTAHLHDSYCPWYESPGSAAKRTEALDGVAAIVERDGQFVVNLQVRLSGATQGDEAAGGFAPHGRAKAERQAATSLTALSWFLLEQGGLTAQRPGGEAANWSGASAWIAEKLLAKTVIGGQPATSVMLLPRLRNSETIRQMASDQRTAWSTNNKPYTLVFGRVLEVRDHDTDHVALRLEYTMMEVVMHKTRWRASIVRSASANAAAAVNGLRNPDRDTGVLVMALVEPGKKFNQWSALTAALVVTSGTFMPVASQPELAVAGRLIHGAGRIDKPMRAHPECPPYVPDFVVTMPDQSKLFMEVAGLNDVQYLEHLREKLAVYETNRLAVWVWFVCAEPVMPAFAPQTFDSVRARLDSLLQAARARATRKVASVSDPVAA